MSFGSFNTFQSIISSGTSNSNLFTSLSVVSYTFSYIWLSTFCIILNDTF